jgi:hypothetical protein
MKLKVALLFLFSLATFPAISQNFEGKIVYKNSYKSKIQGVSDEQFSSMMGTTYEYFIKGGNYKMITNGSFMQSQLYVNADNKVYNKMATSPNYLWNDGAVNPDEVMKAEIVRGATTILGRKCDELVLTCKSGTQRYYYDPNLKVDAKLFEKHKYGNWYDYLSRANAIPLKIYVDNQQFTIESEATDVVPMKLDDKDFQLPVGSTTEKSPY